MNATEKFYAANKDQIEAILDEAFTRLPAAAKGFEPAAYGLFERVRKQAPSHARLTMKGERQITKVSAAAKAAYESALKEINGITA